MSAIVIPMLDTGPSCEALGGIPRVYLVSCQSLNQGAGTGLPRDRGRDYSAASPG